MRKHLNLRSFTLALMVLTGNYLSSLADFQAAIATTPDRIRQQQERLCREEQGNNIGIKACIWLEYDTADRKLNEAYRQLTAKVSPEERSLLTEAQLGWIKLRDNTCEFEVYRSRGGTGFSGFLNACKTRITNQRRVELERYLTKQN
ncbi:lysozyme inhibitor LprI family protein [Pseudanabaena sp. PCC 6802]|uniref:lysozyme inhibitor LprI family protein n=1 Tax=Pseudanabaena sp. PCC 6802 TaxID=118173 RepID=UPI0003499333|nr:lysozyme inhibitor LprI family protein [Pseudanabaena sp. PCC 6802]